MAVTKKGLLLPGYACTSQIWHRLGEELGSTYELTLIDWPTPALPHFHTVRDFAQWLDTACGPQPWDFVMGHSLGGLVALEFAALKKAVIPQLILVETFLLSPAPFFQNLLWATPASAAAHPILEMLSREQGHYSPSLRAALRDITASEQVLQLGRPLAALYGDRGCGQPEIVLNELQWPAALAACVDVHVVPGACHFPMVENASVTAQILRKIIGTYAPALIHFG
jgi:pimeloyl-ACP methyl ester carboxylesterase